MLHFAQYGLRIKVKLPAQCCVLKWTYKWVTQRMF